MALVAGDAWLERGANIILFGPPGGGKTHLAAAIGIGLIENGWRVLFTRTTDLVQKLQIARRDLGLEAAIARLDKYHLLILDDLAYVTKDQAETSVLFELISARYERRSTLITANQPFGDWNRIFPDPAMTLAAVDRLVHHATILEINVESYRRKTAVARQSGPGNLAPDDRPHPRHPKPALIDAPRHQPLAPVKIPAQANNTRDTGLTIQIVAPCSSRSTRYKRALFSVVLVQVKGFGLALCCAR